MKHAGDWNRLYLWVVLGLFAAPAAFYILALYVSLL